jgi:hypothetical protein
MFRRSESGISQIRGSRVSARVLVPALLTALAFVLPRVQAQSKAETSQGSLPTGVEIRSDAVPKKATVGDLITITLDITLPKGYQATVPKPDSRTGDFSIFDFSSGQQTAKQEQIRPAQHHRARITVAVYKTGTFVFPPLQILLRTDKGAVIEVLSPPVSVEIQSVLTGANQNLKDLKKQAAIGDRPWILWIALVAAACIAAFILWKIRIRRRRPAIPASAMPGRDPLEAAEADLRKLIERGLPDPDREKEFYVLLSEIVKRIIEIGYRIHTAEQTTSEIMGGLRQNRDAGRESLEQIESFLLRCDMVKFARYVPSRSEQETVCTGALGILKGVVSRRAQLISGQPAVGSGQKEMDSEQ